MRSWLYLAYSVAVLVLGIVLLLVTGTAGIILIAAGVVGVVMNLTILRR